MESRFPSGVIKLPEFTSAETAAEHRALREKVIMDMQSQE